MRANSCRSAFAASEESTPRVSPRCMASKRRAVSCDVKALVEATPISGPAWVMMEPAASRVIIEPTTLQMATVGERFRIKDRVAIAKFAAVVHFYGHAGEALDHEFSGKTGVPACAAGDDTNF